MEILLRVLSEDEKMWLDDVIQRIGPGGNFLSEKSTVANIRSGEWMIPRLGVHEAQELWEMAGKKNILEETHEKVENLLSTHKPLPLSDEVEKELDKIQKRANQSSE